MKYILIAVKDRAVNAFQPINCVRAEGEGIRNFQDAINDPSNRQLHAHADDFDLYVVGYFDDTTGRLETLDEPKELARGKALKMQVGISMTTGR